MLTKKRTTAPPAMKGTTGRKAGTSNLRNPNILNKLKAREKELKNSGLSRGKQKAEIESREHITSQLEVADPLIQVLI